MMRLALSPLLMVLLAAYFVVGLSHFAIASDPMAIEMARPAAFAMSAMGWQHQTPEKPCEPGPGRCPTGCIAPGASLPTAAALVPPAPGPLVRLVAEAELEVGMTTAPGAPPPRTTYIG